MRLIDADEAQERFYETYCKNCNNYNGVRCRACELKDGADIYDDMQEVDAMTVVHGHWTQCGTKRVCSVCGVKVCAWAVDCTLKYCPNCGSRMDEKDGDSDATD